MDGKVYSLDILDTAGQDEYSALRERYMKTGHGYILMYDITNEATFDQLSELYEEIIRAKERNDVPLIVVGNKSDLESERQVEMSYAKSQAKKWGAEFLESSAKGLHNVEEVFEEIVRATTGKKKGGKKKKFCNLV